MTPITKAELLIRKWLRANSTLTEQTCRMFGNQIARMLEENERSFIKDIQDALGTAETGENLVAVARDAHRAEQELAALEIAAERAGEDYIDIAAENRKHE